MNQSLEDRAPAVSSDALREALTQALSGHMGRPCVVARLGRRPFAYSTSVAMEELEVELGHGASLELLFKDLSRQALLAGAWGAKPDFLYNPLREIDTYRQILAFHPLGTATCYGAVVQPLLDRHWLFLEKVRGVELYQEGDLAIWQRVAVWLAGLHARFAQRAEQLLSAVPLLVYDRNYYRQWLSRAQPMVGSLRGAVDTATYGLEKLATHYDQIIDRLMTLPTTLLHGEFYASNVLVEKAGVELRICPVDWEMAAVGPGLIDLAALVAGKWSESAKESMALAYHVALTQAGIPTPAWEVFLVALDCCRLHQAIQWLGWSSIWSPPPAQAQDWLGEALRLAEKLVG